MKSKLFLISLAAVLALSLGLTGCGTTTTTPPLYNLTFSDHNPQGNACADALTTYANYIADHSGGKVVIKKIGYAGEILPQMQAFAGVQADTADAASYVPEIGDGIQYMQVMAMPFMGWQSPQAAIDVYNNLTAKFPQMQQQFTSKGLVFATLDMMPAYQLNYYASNFSAAYPADIHGLTINCLEGNLASIITMLGASGSVLSFTDALTGIPSHVGDGFCMHLEFCSFFGLLPYLPSHTLFQGGIVMTPIGVIWNKTVYDGVVTAVGQSVMDAAAAAWLHTFLTETAVDTAGWGTYFATHPQTIVSLNRTQIVDNGWVGNVSSYYGTWESACADPSVATQIYGNATALIASWPSWVP